MLANDIEYQPAVLVECVVCEEFNNTGIVNGSDKQERQVDHTPML